MKAPNMFAQAGSTGRTEHGAALVMALVILMILTILGVAALNTASFEERMAGNIQESMQAFEAAESGLNSALNAPGTFVLDTPTSNTYTYGSNKADVTNSFREFSPPKRGLGYSATSFDAANFNQQATGTAGGGARSVMNRGVAQIVPK